MKAIVITWLASTLVASGTSQAPGESPDPMALLRPLAGHWEGIIDSSLGVGTGVREYEWILEDQFLLFRHESVRKPQEKSPGGDHHREFAIFSFDSERKKIVLREYMVEGVVTRYGCDVEKRKLTCVSEHVESGPGISGRLTLDIESPHAFTEEFALTFPGDTGPSVHFTNQWSRVPMLK